MPVGLLGGGHLPLLSGWRERGVTVSPCPRGRISHARAGWCFCAHSPRRTWPWERQARGAGVAVVPQSCSWPRAGRHPDVAARAVPAVFPSLLTFPGLPEAECQVGSVVPGVMFFLGVGGHPPLLDQIHLHQLTGEDPLAKAGAGDQLLALSQHLIFRSQCVPVPPEGRRPPRAAHGVGCSCKQ